MAKCNNCKNLETKDNGFDAYSWCEKINDCPHEDIERDCEHYVPMINTDRFAEFFQRCLADMNTCCGNYESETAVMMEKAFTESKIYDQNKVVKQLEERTAFLKDCTKYGNKTADQQSKSYDTMMMYEVKDLVDELLEIVKEGGTDAEH